MSIRDERLLNEFERMKTLAAESTLIDFKAIGDPPEKYLVLFKCKGLAKADVISEEHIVSIYLHADYPRKPPIVRWKTPVFHPNISFKPPNINHPVTGEPMAFDDLLKIFENAGIELPEDIRDGKICLDILEEINWSPKVTLDILCIELGEMIQYKKYNLGDPLDKNAARWAKANKDILPVDNRELLDYGIILQESKEIDITFYD